jgi:short-subunit dehydrogenase
MTSQSQSPAPARQTALVTGASSGIGLDLARLLAERGHDLILVARSRATLDQLAADLSAKHGISATSIPADLSDPATPQRLYDDLAARRVTIDLLINNAGFGLFGSFVQQDEHRITELLQVNITALTALTRLFLPGMIARNRGRVMNVASTAGFQPGPYMAIYYASKAYVISFTEAVSEELRHTDVTLTALCPGPTLTNFADVAQMTFTNLFNTPFLMSSIAVARYGYDAMMRGQRIAIPGIINRVVAFSNRLAPRRLATTISRRLLEHR